MNLFLARRSHASHGIVIFLCFHYYLIMNHQTAVTALSALAQASRLAVYRHLVQCGPTGASPGEISGQLNIPGATLSFHLKSLQHAGLIDAKKTGRTICYRTDFAAMNALLGFLTENCCAGDPAACMPTIVAGKSCTLSSY